MESLPDALIKEILSFLPVEDYFFPLAKVSKRFRSIYPFRTTKPLKCLFLTPWYKPNSTLQINLLEFFVVECHWDWKKPGSQALHKVLCGTISRGDLEGLRQMLGRGLIDSGTLQKDPDYCTIAGAAGHLEVLQWLKNIQQCPWDPAEVYREASENLHGHIMNYVERCCPQHVDVRSCYGDGLPY